jgi:hypothetical protein
VRDMRVATFYTGGGNDRAELRVSKFGTNGFGALLINFNRWRQEVGLSPIDDVGKQPFDKTTIPSGNVAFFEFVAPENASSTSTAADGPKRSYVAMLAKGGEVWFFKLIGPAKTVADQRTNFDSFLKSIQFGEAGE